MALIRKSKLKEMTLNDMEQELKKTRSELQSENASRATGGKPKSPGRVRQLRRLVARLTTLMRQKSAKKG